MDLRIMQTGSKAIDLAHAVKVYKDYGTVIIFVRMKTIA